MGLIPGLENWVQGERRAGSPAPDPTPHKQSCGHAIGNFPLTLNIKLQMSRSAVETIVQKVREGIPISSAEIAVVTSNSIVTRGKLRSVALYMIELEGKIVYCTQDGIMSDARSLADASCHHEHGEEKMLQITDEMGLTSRPSRRARSGREKAGGVPQIKRKR